jgi:homospermidine synthase
VLGIATRYLGTMHSGPADWDPVSTRRDLFAEFGDEAAGVDHADPWQFTNFLLPG